MAPFVPDGSSPTECLGQGEHRHDSPIVSPGCSSRLPPAHVNPLTQGSQKTRPGGGDATSPPRSAISAGACAGRAARG